MFEGSFREPFSLPGMLQLHSPITAKICNFGTLQRSLTARYYLYMQS